jgi:RNA polymerase sigma factor (sigma-70 family)
MAHAALGYFSRQLESLLEDGSAAGLSDRQLLERFTSRDEPTDQAAFAAIVARHGPMVLGLCRQLLGDHHHAEDAFQAVFLVLARQARTIRDPDLLGTWLYGVAVRTASFSRGRIARRREIEDAAAIRPLRSISVPAVEQAMIEREQAEALHREIERLPGAFRMPVVLCYFEGLTLDEAAHRLRWPAGTLRSRLARAREKLRRGLLRRGFTFSSTALAAAQAARSARASISSLRCDRTARAAIQFAASHAGTGALTAPATALARRMIFAMLGKKLIIATVALLLLGTLAAGVGHHLLAVVARSPDGEPRGELGRTPARTEPRPPDGEPRGELGRTPARTEPRPPNTMQGPPTTTKNEPRPAPGRMFVVGRVLDPAGKPVRNAMTMVYAATKQPGSAGGGSVERMKPSALGHAQSDDSGRFQIDAPRTSSSRHHRMGVVAIAPGYGAGWVEVDPAADRPTANISLTPEQVISGRLFDAVGRSVAGVEVRVQSMGRVIAGNRESMRGEGPSFWWNPGDGLPAWPKRAVSDAEGRFTVRGVGQDLRVMLMIDDPRFARQVIPIRTDGNAASTLVSLAVMPAKVIRGRIADAGSGKPIPHAQIKIMTVNAGGGTINEFEADAEGRFRANPLSADRYEVSAMAPDGQPYLGVSKLFDWPKGAVEYPIDMALPRGMVIRGKVVEEGTGKPVAAARISFATLQSVERQSGAMNGRTASGPDGSFQLGVLPSPGHLVVLGPSDDYVLREIDSGLVRDGKPGGRRFYAHALVSCSPKPDGTSLDVTVTLRPAMPVSGRVIGPDGQAVESAWMISRVCIAPSPSAWWSWRANHHGSAKSGRFELHGLDSDAESPVYFLDPHHKLGAAVSFSGRSAAGEPITVRLQPCGAARARLVDTAGKPIAGYRGSRLVSMVVTAPYLFRHQEATLAVIDNINYGVGPVSDAAGRIAFPALIPGTPYRLSNFKAGTQRFKDFTVKPAATVDLGDFVIEEPRAQ